MLFEMLTGKRAFPGEDLTDTLAAVVRAEPNWTLLPAGLPSALVVYLKRCLQKDPKQRAQAIGDVRLALEGAFETAAPQTTPLAAAAPRSVVARALPWALAGTFGVALIAALLLWAPWRSAPVPAPRTLLASIGADASLPTTLGASAILAPDGTTLAFVAQQAGQTRLFVRKLDQLQATALAGTEGAQNPFFSPDGQWIAFFSGGSLKKISATGGAAVTLCDAPQGRGGTWAGDTIVFTPTNAANTTLMRVSAAGGTPAVFGALSPGATRQRWPQALPGEAVLFTEHSSGGNWDAANLVVAPLSGGVAKVVVRGGYYGRYVPSGPGSPQRDEREGGHLIYLQQGTLFAVRFDLTRLETVGPAVPALEDVAASVTGGAQLAVSSEGTLVYVPGTAWPRARPIDWLTRDGKTAVLRSANADWANPRFSPDGQKLAVEIFDGKQRDLWVYEWAQDTLRQLTFDPADDSGPVWTPDGRRLVFASDRAKAGVANLYWVNADGSGDVTRLTDSPEYQVPRSWHPSGKFLAFSATRPATGQDLLILPMEGDATRGWTPGTPTVFLSTPAMENVPMFSPDGRWIAYWSNEAVVAGDVYVRPFPGPGGKWRISTASGQYPLWSATAPELLFVALGLNTVMTAPYAVVGDSFRADTPQVWSPASIQAGATTPDYDLHPDGKRVAAAVQPDSASGVQDKVVFVFNFGDYLRTIAPGVK